MLDRRRRRRPAATSDGVAVSANETVALDAADATADLAAPAWLRDLGTSAWLLAGVAVVLVGAVWIASLTHAIVTPVITAAVIASVMSPLVSWLHRRGLPRGLGAALLLLAVVAVGLAVTLVVVGGVTGESPSLQSHLSQARQTITGWLTDLGVSPEQAHGSDEDVGSAIEKAVPALLHGVSSGIAGLSSLVVFVAFTVLSLFFLLKDGPAIRAWGERHTGLPAPLARTVSGRSLQSLRGYFFGVKIVAAFNALVVALRALLLGVANGILQQLLQPIAYRAALGIHPLAVLIVTISAAACSARSA